AASTALNELGEPADKRGMFSLLGSSPIRGGPRPRATGGSGSHIASVQILLVPADDREMDSEAYMERWRALTGPVFEAKKLTFSASMGPSAGKPVDVEINHTDPAVLERAAQDVADALAGYGGVTDIENGVAEGKPQLDLKLTPEAKGLGLTSNDIARQVRASFYGSEALRQQEGRDEVRVLTRLPVEERTSEYNIETLLIRTPEGGEIPLVEAASLQRGVSWPEIERADGGRLLHVTAEVDEEQTTPGVVIETLTTDVLNTLGDRYPGLTYGFGGENREQKDTTEALASGGKLALIVIFALLAIPFKSYVQPLIVMVAIPFGFVGAVIGHVVMGYSLSMISMMGIVALSGVVINDSLVLIAAANTYRKQGMPPWEAIQAAGARRFRPILLTSITTFLGLMPMILETSVQARFLVPMAISLGFGVMFATFIILLLVPCFYMMVEDARRLLFGAELSPAAAGGIAATGADDIDINLAEVEVALEPPPRARQPQPMEPLWRPGDDEIEVLYEDDSSG
ncbi:MAG: efflux RND transporter permease subunit, partial [Nannocystaceae bacterium]